jgi:SPP1 gp7 family putative phage head morphogenesis protein
VLAAILDPLDAAVAAALGDAGFPVRLDAQGDAPELPGSVAAAIRRFLSNAAKGLPSSRAVDAIVARAAKGADAHSRAMWAAQAKALGIDLGDDLFLAARMKAFRKANVALIKSMVGEHVARVHRVLKAAGSGTRVEVIQRQLQEATGASKSRAALIARDQVLSLNAQVTRDRHAAAGITEYVWRTSRDERVRSRHKELEGTRHAYDDPPVVDAATGRRAHPGEDFQCRCTAEPVLPGIDDG